MENIFVGRVVSEDDDFILLEVGKHDSVSWTIAPAPGEEQRDPPRFFTLAFIRANALNDVARAWNPFAESAE